MTHTFEWLGAMSYRWITARIRWVVIGLLGVLIGAPLITMAVVMTSMLLQRRAVTALYEEARAVGQVPVTQLEAGWDQICVATAYCGGRGDLDWDICDSFQEDGVWGIVFFNKGAVTAIRKYTGHVRYKAEARCFSVEENPAVVPAGDKLLTIRPTR